MDIYVDIDILSAKSSEIDDYLDDLMNQINDGKNIIDEMKFNWEGSSYVNFNTKMIDFYDSLNRGMKKMQIYNDYLKDYIKDMDSLEEKYESKTIELT